MGQKPTHALQQNYMIPSYVFECYVTFLAAFRAFVGHKRVSICTRMI
jgi:hypothetical protein